MSHRYGCSWTGVVDFMLFVANYSIASIHYLCNNSVWVIPTFSSLHSYRQPFTQKICHLFIMADGTTEVTGGSRSAYRSVYRWPPSLISFPHVPNTGEKYSSCNSKITFMPHKFLADVIRMRILGMTVFVICSTVIYGTLNRYSIRLSLKTGPAHKP